MKGPDRDGDVLRDIGLGRNSRDVCESQCPSQDVVVTPEKPPRRTATWSTASDFLIENPVHPRVEIVAYFLCDLIVPKVQPDRSARPVPGAVNLLAVDTPGAAPVRHWDGNGNFLDLRSYSPLRTHFRRE